MSWSKKASVAYHFIESSEDNYYSDLGKSFESLLGSENPSGSFDSNEVNYYWNILEELDLNDSKTYFISVVKEKDSGFPVWYSERLGVGSIPLEEGLIGELFYALINPDKRFILTLAGTSGSATSAFKKFLNEFSKEGGIKFTPLLEEKIELKTLSWNKFKKVATTFTFPTLDDVSEFTTTGEGQLIKLLDELGGFKVDITISAPKQSQYLNLSQTKEIAKNILDNDFCTKLVLKGSDSSEDEIQEFDLKNAQVKYSEPVEIEGSYMDRTLALSVLKRAYDERQESLIHFSE